MIEREREIRKDTASHLSQSAVADSELNNDPAELQSTSSSKPAINPNPSKAALSSSSTLKSSTLSSSPSTPLTTSDNGTAVSTSVVSQTPSSSVSLSTLVGADSPDSSRYSGRFSWRSLRRASRVSELVRLSKERFRSPALHNSHA